MRQRPLIDTFLFSEHFELEVLLAKLHVESEVVDHWIAVQNRYTTKGEPKNAQLAELVRSDTRFHRFLDRLTIITLDQAYAADYKPSVRNRLAELAYGLLRSNKVKNYREHKYFFAERAQRDAASAAAIEIAGRYGSIMVSDVDEMLDGSTPLRRDILRRAVDSGAAVIHLPRRRFVFDYDNVSMARYRHVPLVAASALRSGTFTLGGLRQSPFGIPATPEPIVFEYSYCYTRVAIERKLSTFAHLHPGDEAIGRALRCNHALTVKAADRMRNVWWYETIDVEEARHPSYIADNLQRLRTGAVNPDYRRARQLEYPSLFPQ